MDSSGQSEVSMQFRTSQVDTVKLSMSQDILGLIAKAIDKHNIVFLTMSIIIWAILIRIISEWLLTKR